MNNKELIEHLNALTIDEVVSLNLDIKTQNLIMETKMLKSKNELAAQQLKYWWVPNSDFMALLLFAGIIALMFID